MPRWDFQCTHCHRVTERVFTTYEMMQRASEHKLLSCDECGCSLERLPSAGTSFVVNGHNAKNGYSKG